MSRSYKHTPVLKDLHRDIRWRKRAASKAVRRYLGLTNGKMYRKVYNSWDIHDYVCYIKERDGIKPKYFRK